MTPITSAIHRDLPRGCLFFMIRIVKKTTYKPCSYLIRISVGSLIPLICSTEFSSPCVILLIYIPGTQSFGIFVNDIMTGNIPLSTMFQNYHNSKNFFSTPFNLSANVEESLVSVLNAFRGTTIIMVTFLPLPFLSSWDSYKGFRYESVQDPLHSYEVENLP